MGAHQVTPSVTSSELPRGAVTFLFTDIVDSTMHWTTDQVSMRVALAVHDDVVTSAITGASGHLVKHTGDGYMAVFNSVVDAISAATAAQLGLADASWDGIAGGRLHVRMGIHTGEAQFRVGDYFGVAPNRAARVMSVAQGDQILVSEASSQLATEASLPAGIGLVPCGEVVLKGVSGVERPRQVAHVRLRGDFPTLMLRVGTSKLPKPLTTMIGREVDARAGLDLLVAARLVTLTGYGGVGKTRLAVEIAQRADHLFADGVFWVELSSANDLSAIVNSVAAAVDVMGGSNREPIDAIAESYATRDALIVLDDCEHAAADVAGVARTLLERCDRLRLLVTSRVPLGVAGEQLMVIDTLPIDTEQPSESSPAVQLFLERARSSSRSFELTTANRADVIELCRHLDGLPLAIELAASRARSMTPAQMVRRLGDRFRMLDANRSGDGDRHQSMLRTLEWSYGLLSPPLQALFDRLSLFLSSFDCDAAEQTCSGGSVDELDVADLLSQLVDHSMLSVIEVEPGADARYQMVETFRAYGRERLSLAGELAERQRLFAHYWLAFAERADAGVRGPDEGRWRRAISLDIGNLRAAHAISLSSGDVDGALRMVVALNEYAFAGMRSEIADWAVAANAMDGAAAHPLWADAAAVAVLLAWTRGAWGAVETHLDALNARAELASPCGNYLVEFARGLVAAFRGRMDEQCDQYEICHGLAEADGDQYRLVTVSGQLAFARTFVGREGATEIGERAVEMGEALANPTALSAANWGLGITLIATDPARALRCFARSAQLARSVGASLNETSAELSAIGVRDRSASPLDELSFLLDRWEYWHRAGSTPAHWHVLQKVALSLLRGGEPSSAAVVLGAEQAATLRLARSAGDERRIAGAMSKLATELGEADLTELLAFGATLDQVELGQYVFEALQRAVVSLRRVADD